MAWSADELEHAAAEIELDDLVRPGREPVELLHSLEFAIDDGGCRSICELRVSLNVVEMAMGVGNDELVALARMIFEPRVDDLVHGLAQGIVWPGLLARPGVEEHRPLATEQQKEEGRLGSEGLALPQHVRMRVVPLHLEGRVGFARATRPAVNPTNIEIPVDRRASGEVEIVQGSNEITLRMPSWACMSSKPRLTSSSDSVCEISGSTSMSPAR